ncbi:hypothetical protein Mgra_00001905 [Meloidogyne graminicola]|uniref:Uncharacterized protein n=1 Tax=Meloidogyne graminicola TaxID=189291 RepID=A0A8S9ZXW4_9BILA|nr:hypothetical protein Mgra_00001905 [Meloidogyne graminicola]
MSQNHKFYIKVSMNNCYWCFIIIRNKIIINLLSIFCYNIKIWICLTNTIKFIKTFFIATTKLFPSVIGPSVDEEEFEELEEKDEEIEDNFCKKKVKLNTKKQITKFKVKVQTGCVCGHENIMAQRFCFKEEFVKPPIITPSISVEFNLYFVPILH